MTPHLSTVTSSALVSADRITANSANRDLARMRAARKFETVFIAEMLKSAGLGKGREALGGGPGEDGFGSFLVQVQAEEIAKTGGFGLAGSIERALAGMEAKTNVPRN